MIDCSYDIDQFSCDFFLRHIVCINSVSVCYAGDIRLTGTGSTVSQGNVELCITNQFNAICGNVWSSNDAKVVCRQLGFNSSKFVLHKFHMCIILHYLGVECVLQNDGWGLKVLGEQN